MKFVDEAEIEVHGGDGGPGIVSFRREAHVPRGGPDGGDGGHGGDVLIEATERVTTLLDHRYRRHYRGEAGKAGGPKNMTGRRGKPCVIPVPPGTVILDAETGDVIADLVDDGDQAVVARGGRGGLGNAHFVTSTRQAPRMAQDGRPGEARTLRLSLKLVADVGLVGLPNAGKSTFLRAVTRSQAQVGAYPFTTLVPNLGVYRRGDRDVVVADVPGLIAGAHDGQGLGDRFLKHLERTRALIHLISVSPTASADPISAYDVVQEELAQWSRELAALPQILVLNQIDVLDDRYEIELWREEFAKRGLTFVTASGLSGEHVHDVMTAAMTLLGEPEAEPDREPEPWSPL